MYYVGQDLYRKWLCSHIFNVMYSEGGGDPQKINNQVCTVKVALSITLQSAADLPHGEDAAFNPWSLTLQLEKCSNWKEPRSFKIAQMSPATGTDFDLWRVLSSGNHKFVSWQSILEKQKAKIHLNLIGNTLKTSNECFCSFLAL